MSTSKRFFRTEKKGHRLAATPVDAFLPPLPTVPNGILRQGLVPRIQYAMITLRRGGFSPRSQNCMPNVNKLNHQDFELRCRVRLSDQESFDRRTFIRFVQRR